LLTLTYVRGDDYTDHPSWVVFQDGRRQGVVAEHAGGWPVEEHATAYYTLDSVWPGVARPAGRYPTRDAAADAAVAANSASMSGSLLGEGLTEVQRTVLDVEGMFPAGHPGDGTLDRVVRERLHGMNVIQYLQILRNLVLNSSLRAAADDYAPATIARVARRFANTRPRRARRAVAAH
jgi:hypothetical protein